MGFEHITAKLGIDSSEFREGLNSTKRGLKSLSDGLGAIGVGFGIGAIASGLNTILDKFDAIQNKSEELGVSTDFFQQWTLGARRAGLEADDAEKAITKLNIAVGEARQKGDDWKKSVSDLNIQFGDLNDKVDGADTPFKTWGIALNDASGNALNLEQIIDNIANKMAELPDPTQRARLAFELFGKKGPAIAAMLSEGAEGLRKFKEAAKGQIIGKDTIDDVVEAKHAIDEMKDSLILGVGSGIGLVAKLAQGLGEATVSQASLTNQFNSFGDALTAIERRSASMFRSARERRIFDAQQAEKARAAEDAMLELRKAQRGVAYALSTETSKLAMMEEERADLFAKLKKEIPGTVEALKIQTQIAEKDKDIAEQRLRIAAQLDSAFQGRKAAERELALDGLSAAQKLKVLESERAQIAFDVANTKGNALANEQQKTKLAQKDLEIAQARKVADQERLGLLNEGISIEQRRIQIARESRDFRGEEAARKRMIDLARQEAAILLKSKDIEGERVKLRQSVASAQLGVKSAERELATAKSDRSKFTLQELADSGNFRGSLGRDQQAARRVLFLEEQGRATRGTGASQRFFSQADALRKSIQSVTDAERNPFKSQEDAVQAAKDTLAVQKAQLDILEGKGNPVPTRPTFGA